MGEASHPEAVTRLSLLRRRIRSARLHAVLITHLPNIFYLSGFTGSSAVLVLGPSTAELFTDARYAIQAKEETSRVGVRIAKGSLLGAAGKLLKSNRLHRLGFEASHISAGQMAALSETLGKGASWIPWDGNIEKARAVKDPQEISTMREAASLACSAWEEVLPLVKPGVVESDLAAEIDYRMRRKGASGPAFDTIVASGARSAWPHARASRKTINKNELVVFDLGAILRGYSSDMSRTVFVGHASSLIRRWYQAVRDGQEAARETLRPGVTAGRVDAAARAVLAQAGFAENFVHSTGHGLGLEVHEMPRLGRGEKMRLAKGMVVTLEPGVYFEGQGGIRIEDDALVTDSGAELLTHATRELIELG